MTCELILLNGENKGAVCAINEDEICKIGRDPSCKICLNDKTASKVHAIVSCVNGKLTVVDLSSRNGTFVNGARIQTARLAKSDTLTIGNSVFQLATSGDIVYRTAYDSVYPEDGGTVNQVGVPAGAGCGTGPASLLELQDVVRQSSLNMLKKSVKTIFNLLPVSRVALFNADDKGLRQGYTVVRRKDLQESPGRKRLSVSFAQYVLEQEDPILFSSRADMDLKVPGALTSGMESKSIIGVPIILNGLRKGVLLCDSLDAANSLTAEDLQVVKYVSREIAPFQEN